LRVGWDSGEEGKSEDLMAQIAFGNPMGEELMVAVLVCTFFTH
jgi:hypothetical protein